MKKMLLIITFLPVIALQAMQPGGQPPQGPDESSPEKLKKKCDLDKYTPSKRGLQHVLRARELESQGVAPKRIRRHIEMVEDNLEQAASFTVTDPEKAARINTMVEAVWLYKARLSPAGKSLLSAGSPLYSPEQHQLFFTTAKNVAEAGDSDAGLLPVLREWTNVARFHNPHGRSSGRVLTHAWPARHIEGNAGGGGHILDDKAALELFRVQSADCGVALEFNEQTGVWHGARLGIGKTMFPVGMGLSDVLAQAARIVDTNEYIIARNTIDGERYKTLGQDAASRYVVEVKERGFVVETVYPIFSFVEWDKRKKTLELAQIVGFDGRRQVIFYTPEQIQAMAQRLVAHHSATKDTLSPSDAELQNPTVYKTKDSVIIDIARALLERGVTQVDHGFYVKFPKSAFKGSDENEKGL